MVDGTFYVNDETLIQGPVKVQGRTPQTHPAVTGMDGIIADDGTTGQPSIGVVLGDHQTNPTVRHFELGLYALRFEQKGATQRANSGVSTLSFGMFGLAPTNVSYLTAYDVVVHGSSRAAIWFSRSCRNVWLRHVQTNGSYADGCTLATATKRALIEHSEINNAQDDLFAVFGVTSESSMPSDITFRYNRARGGTVAGNGFRVMGGYNVLSQYNSIERYYQWGFVAGSDSVYQSGGTADVRSEYDLFSKPNSTSTPSAIRLFGRSGTDSDGNPLTAEDIEVVGSVFDSASSRLIHFGNDNGTVLTARRITLDGITAYGPPATAGTNDFGVYGCVDSFTLKNSKLFRIGAGGIRLVSNNNLNKGVFVLSNNEWQIALRNTASDDWLFASGMDPDNTLQTWLIETQTVTSPNVWQRMIETASNLHNVTYNRESCITSPDADDRANHPGYDPLSWTIS